MSDPKTELAEARERIAALEAELAGRVPTDVLHNDGKCRCNGEGTCFWCVRIELAEARERIAVLEAAGWNDRVDLLIQRALKVQLATANERIAALEKRHEKREAFLAMAHNGAEAEHTTIREYLDLRRRAGEDGWGQDLASQIRLHELTVMLRGIVGEEA